MKKNLVIPTGLKHIRSEYCLTTFRVCFDGALKPHFSKRTTTKAITMQDFPFIPTLSPNALKLLRRGLLYGACYRLVCSLSRLDPSKTYI